MSDQSKGGIYIVDPETGEAKSVTSEELIALLISGASAPKPVPSKPSPRKPPQELTNATEN
jgi:hypothetical protein